MVYVFKRWLLPIAALLSLATPMAALAQSVAEVRAQDLRLARIADAMLIANASLCRATMPATGMILHSADQYGESAQHLFANGSLAIAAVVPGSPAAQLGLRANDGITGISGREVTGFAPHQTYHLREVAFFDLASLPEGDMVDLVVSREGELSAVSFPAPRGCRALVEIIVEDGANARSDGRIIQLQYDFVSSLSEPQLAVLLAHELAHVVLEHRRRKEEAGIDNASIMRHVGRNQQANRQAEIEADRLSVHLLANAGYDPAIVAQFWQSPEGMQAGGGAMPSWIYPSQSARAELVLREVARHLPLRQGPSWPGHLLEMRDDGLTRD